MASQRITLKRSISLSLTVALTVGSAWSALAMRTEPSPETYSAEVVATGLHQPRAMTQDREGVLLVSETGLRQISRIVQRTAYPFLTKNFSVSRNVHVRAERPDLDSEHWIENDLRAPSDLDIDADGRLLVTESEAGGRLLQFEPFTDNLAFAHVVATPWMDLNRGMMQIESSPDGYLVLSSQRKDVPGMPFGDVTVRRPDGEWLLIDHGPFASFSSLSLDPETGVLLICEETEGSLTWYDLQRQMEISHKNNLRGIRHAVITAGGETLAAVERSDGSWSIIEVDPNRRMIFECRNGLTKIGGLFAHPTENEIYASLEDEGKIMRIRQLQDGILLGDGDIRTLQKNFELTHYLAPKKWPAFFKAFVEKLGVVNPVDDQFLQYVGDGGAKDGKPMTVKQFSDSVPLIAAKMKATLLSNPELEKDPLDEMSFVIFYPNRSMVTKTTVAPSISLFKGTTRKGRIHRTRFLPNADGQPVSDLMSWSELPEVLVSFPSGYYARPTAQEDPNVLRVYFLGVGLGSDYWITIRRDDLSASRMIVEKTDGTKLEYQLEPFQDDASEENATLIVAGLKKIESQWLQIGSGPVRDYVSVGDMPALNHRHAPKLKEFFPELVNMQQEFFGASDDELNLSREEIEFRRTVVVRSATRW